MDKIFKYYEIKVYVDETGREIEEQYCPQDNIKRYAVIVTMPMPVKFNKGILPVATRIPYIIKDCKNVADAFQQFDSIVEELKKEYANALEKPVVQIAKNI